MSYRIVVDSCGEFTEEMAKDSHFVHAALNLEIDGNHFVDDETFDRLRFLDLAVSYTHLTLPTTVTV